MSFFLVQVNSENRSRDDIGKLIYFPSTINIKHWLSTIIECSCLADLGTNITLSNRIISLHSEAKSQKPKAKIQYSIEFFSTWDIQLWSRDDISNLIFLPRCEAECRKRPKRLFGNLSRVSHRTSWRFPPTFKATWS